MVEDNLDHATLVMRTLEEHHISNRVHHVQDGEQALDYLFRDGPYTDPNLYPEPHLILLDLRLPKVDGMEVLERLKQHKKLRQTPVVILTTSKSEIDVAKAYQFHANSYIVKPLDFSNFEELMDALGFYWLKFNYFPIT